MAFKKAGYNNIVFPFLFFSLLLSLPAYSLVQVDPTKEHLCRWHINYAGYLIDVGRYLEALEHYETTFELATNSKTKTETLLSKANLLAAFLDAPEEAIKVYMEVIKNYPQGAELALYRQGLLFFELKHFKEATKVLEDYKKNYPQGHYRFHVEALLDKSKKVTPLPSSLVTKRPMVRIRLCKGKKKAFLSGSLVCISEIGCRKQFKITTSNGHLMLDGKLFKNREITVESIEPITVSCSSKIKKVRGEVKVKLKNNRLLVLNILEIEDYLLSVVPSESLTSWPLEALKTQAVAARTYAYYQVLHRKNWDYDLVDDEGDQVYGGFEQEHPRSTKAIHETEGMVLNYRNRPILAMYTANSGGYTADAKAIFNLHKPYLRAHPDPESLKGKMALWKKRYTVSEIEAALRRIGIQVSNLKGIESAEVGPSGRIIKIKIHHGKSALVLRTRTTLRRALKLPEILITIEQKGRHFIFEGRGWGHGVGFSQWGGAFMGKNKNHRDILKFYYPGTKLVKNW